MQLEAIAGQLAALDQAPGPSVVRFDDGPGFRTRVAVLPSAFNPPTAAHAGLLELAATLPDIGATAALLSTRNVDKGIFGASLADRIGMLLAARETDPDLAVLASNAARIADQAAALREAWPGIGFDFVVGYDTLVRLFEPRYYDDMDAALRGFFAQHRVIAANRADATTEDVLAYLETPVVRPYRDRIVVLELDEARAALSSTAVRNGQPLPIDPVVPPVARYIAERGLYRSETIAR